MSTMRNDLVYLAIFALVVQGKEKPADKFDLLEVVKEVPAEQVTYDASIFGGELGPVNSKC